MPRIQSLAGRQPHSTRIMQNDYDFQFDRQGRLVADVPIERHVNILLSAGTYRLVPDDEPVPSSVKNPPPDDAATTAMRALIASAGAPKIRQLVDGTVYAEEPWPTRAKMPTIELTGTLPPFIAPAPGEGLDITVANGHAIYEFVGRSGDDTVFLLAPGATYTAYQPPQSQQQGQQSQATGITGLTNAAAALPVTEISGIGEGTAKKLEVLGITTVGQIAALSDAQINDLDTKASLNGAIVRGNWVKQAQELLAKG